MNPANGRHQAVRPAGKPAGRTKTASPMNKKTIKEEILALIGSVPKTHLPLEISRPRTDNGCEYGILARSDLDHSKLVLVDTYNGLNSPVMLVESLSPTELYGILRDLLAAEGRSLYEDYDPCCESGDGLEWESDANGFIGTATEVLSMTPRTVACKYIKQVLSTLPPVVYLNRWKTGRTKEAVEDFLNREPCPLAPPFVTDYDALNTKYGWSHNFWAFSHGENPDGTVTIRTRHTVLTLTERDILGKREGGHDDETVTDEAVFNLEAWMNALANTGATTFEDLRGMTDGKRLLWLSDLVSAIVGDIAGQNLPYCPSIDFSVIPTVINATFDGHDCSDDESDLRFLIDNGRFLPVELKGSTLEDIVKYIKDNRESIFKEILETVAGYYEEYMNHEMPSFE